MIMARAARHASTHSIRLTPSTPLRKGLQPMRVRIIRTSRGPRIVRTKPGKAGAE